MGSPTKFTGMSKIHSTLVGLLLGLSVGVVPLLAYEDCNAIYASGDGSHNPGKCTTFFECPFLFEILKSPYKTKNEIKLLQDLTCRPDNDNPTVCCAIEDIRSDMNNTADYNQASKGSFPNSVQDTSDSICFGAGCKIRSSTKRPEISPDISSSPSYEDHPGFRMLPALNECSKTVNTDRILGGKEGSILDYPWMARIGYWSYDEEVIKYLCAGTVINKRYILTAAHCTEEINRDEYKPVSIRLGEADRYCHEIWNCSEPMDFEIEDIIAHPGYNRRDKSNDIGLIRVTEDIPYAKTHFISPVCLPFVEEYGIEKFVDPKLTKHLDNGKESAVVAGWGKTRWSDQEGSDYLMFVSLPVISQKQCQKNYENHTRVKITDKQLCAGGERGKDSCGGDSGGGLFVYEPIPVTKKLMKPVLFQMGVVSFGPTHCGVGGLPGVYSSTFAYKGWLLDNLKP